MNRKGEGMTLTDFLLQRIAEDEAVAREATPGKWHADDTYSTVTAEPYTSAREAYDRASAAVDCWVIPESMDSRVGDHNLAHIARHDPARVLAECEAKRRIVERAGFLIDEPDGLGNLCEGILMDLALPYADHEDYREEWRVS